MNMKKAFAVLSLVAAVSMSGAALAQTATAPASKSEANMKSAAGNVASTDKQAISKACSDQANAKNLHGKERKKFRSACKRDAAKGKN